MDWAEFALARHGKPSNLNDALYAVCGDHHTPTNTFLIGIFQMTDQKSRLRDKLHKLIDTVAVEIDSDRHRLPHHVDCEGSHYAAALYRVR